MESCADYDDDVYYADLERQILTLMVDDEDDSNMVSPATASLPPQFHQQMTSNIGTPMNLVRYSPPTVVEDWSRPHVHSWKLPNRENSAGTGVFIPQTPEKTKEGKRGKGVNAYRRIGYRNGSRKDK